MNYYMYRKELEMAGIITDILQCIAILILCYEVYKLKK